MEPDLEATRVPGATAHGGDEGTGPLAIGRYRVLTRLGEGGMGVVYAAEDEQLGRRIALKVLRTGATDPDARRRLVREARLAAGVSHPLICQIYELGEWNGQPYIAMELLHGEPLSARLSGRPLPPAEAVAIVVSIADALAALHGQGIVHRDLKPSNIFLTPHGIKVLDFGLARPLSLEESRDAVTRTDAILGTPRYAAPELLSGSEVDARADIFSAGVVLFEMLAGRPPFDGRTLAAVIHAVLYETPPVLTGSSAIAVIDRVVHRALAKSPAERYATADALGVDLRAAAALVGPGDTAQARPIQRLAVLPFRLLNPDRDVEHLALSFPDALAAALGGFESLVVRSTLASARYARIPLDLTTVATELAVDVVLSGSILRRGDRLRVAAELVGVPSGDVWWSQSTEVPLTEVFDVHELIAQRVCESLPLSPVDRARPPSGRPAAPKAFDIYLRGMQLRMESSSWRQAHAFFSDCLALDPSFAPAWAELGRLDRVLGKYGDASRHAEAQASLARALSLDPGNGAAQCYYAQLDIDRGRVDAALGRLLDRAGQQRAEPAIYAALVHACRYAGLLEASLAADMRARHLDPTVTTSVLHTFYMAGDYRRALDEAHRTSDPLESRVLAALGLDEAAIAAARREETRFAAVPLLRSFATALRAALENRAGESVEALAYFEGQSFSDGEGLFYVAEILARLRQPDRARALLERACAAGFVCLPAFESSPCLTSLHAEAWWSDLAREVRTRSEALAMEFATRGGTRLLG